MIYSKISKPKYKNLFRGLAIVMLLLFSLTINACYTYKTGIYTPEELDSLNKNDIGYNIEDIQFKDSSNLNLDDADYKAIIKDTSKYTLRLIKLHNNIPNGGDTRITQNYKDISLDDILKMRIETQEFSTEKTILGISAALTAIGLLLFAIFANGVPINLN